MKSDKEKSEKRSAKTGLLASDANALSEMIEKGIRVWLASDDKSGPPRMKHATKDGTIYRFVPSTLGCLNRTFKRFTGKFSALLDKKHRPPVSREYQPRSDKNLDAEADKAMRLYGAPRIAAVELQRQHDELLAMAEKDPIYHEMYHFGDLQEVIHVLARRDAQLQAAKKRPDDHTNAARLVRFKAVMGKRPLIPAFRRRRTSR